MAGKPIPDYPNQIKRTRSARPTYDQATKIIDRFGGEAAFALAVGIHRVTAYKWKSPAPWGTDGVIPHGQVERVKLAARAQGIILTDHHWAPNKIVYSDPEPEPSEA